MFETIVVPLDGSALAETAMPYAAELARLTGATLVALRVVEETRPIFDAACRDIIWIDPANPRLELLAPAILEPTLSALRERGLAVSPVVRLGDPRQEIVAEARQHPRPVIVLASHGRGGLSRAVLGSVASRVLQVSPCPVLVVRARDSKARPAEPRFHTIVVPLDGSALAEQALSTAADLARLAGGALHLVRVAETYRDELPEHLDPLTSASHRATLARFAALEEEARRYLSERADELARQGHRVTWEVLSGDPARQLLHYLDRARPDLVVMTTHGRGGAARWLVGSVADKLMTGAEAPLLLIRIKEGVAEQVRRVLAGEQELDETNRETSEATAGLRSPARTGSGVQESRSALARGESVGEESTMDSSAGVRATFEELLRKEHYRPEELAELLGMNIHVIQNAVYNGELEATVLGHDIERIDRSAVLRWLEKRG